MNFDHRAPLAVEGDLGAVLKAHMPSLAKMDSTSSSSTSFADHVFDHVAHAAGLDSELTEEELAAFRSRFAAAMRDSVKEEHDRDISDPASQFIERASAAIESQKPVVTESLVRSLNGANLGFRSQMRDWMVHESVQLFRRRLGRAPLDKDVRKHAEEKKRDSKMPKKAATSLPTSFDARDKWPACADVIGRIHNQGHCGSCWVFGALAPLDSRLCIKTINASLHFDGELASLSRGFAASCASKGNDGCMGGWEYFVYEYIEENPGIPSTACSPYFAFGPGSEHFDQSGPAPPCPGECVGTFPQTMLEDDFKPSGVGQYLLVLKPTPQDLENLKAAVYEGGPVAFGIYANHPFMGYASGIFGLNCTSTHSANHAVHTIGWGQEDGQDFFQGQNSWGEVWGDGGRFKVAPCVLTDYTVPGVISEDHYPLPIPAYTVTTTSTLPPPAPDPDTIACKTDSDTGCITSPNFPDKYNISEKCIISYTFGKIDVQHFDTEYKYDTLTVNDIAYSGKVGPQGVVPHTNIVWSSDFSVTHTGWKICPAAEDD